MRATIYESAPARPFVFKTGSPTPADLNEPLGGGFQAVHIWVNNRSNQFLWLPDANDVVPPKTTRVVACLATDVAHASWTIPSNLGQVQALNPTGAALLIFLHGDIEVAPTPGMSDPATGATLMNPSVVATKISAAGQRLVNVPDTSLFYAGAPVLIITQIAIGGPSQLAFVDKVDPVGMTIELRHILASQVNVGDTVTVLPAITVLSGTRPRAWDGSSQVTGAANTQTSITIAAVAGNEIEITGALWAIVATGANGGGASVRVNNGAAIVWLSGTGVSTQTITDRVTFSGGLAIITAVGVGAIVDFAGAGGAGTIETISVGWYLIGAGELY